MQLIDWCASKKSGGAGLVLLRNLMSRVEVCVSIGGSEETQKIIPVLGFRPVNTLRTFVRPLRALRQLRLRAFSGWRAPAKFVRNSVWLTRSAIRTPVGWSATPTSAEGVPQELWPIGTSGTLVSSRGSALYSYLTQCPTTQFRLYILRRQEKPVGYFCLAITPTQARLADYFLQNPNREAWRALVSFAVEKAHLEKNVCEAIASVTALGAAETLEEAGFRFIQERDFMVHFASNSAASGAFFRLTNLDSDAAFYHSDQLDFIT
jgi:hypothetical protein